MYDDVDYLKSLGRTQTANVKRDAAIGVAQADRDAGIREAECEKEKTNVKYKSDTQVADAEREFKMKKAQYDKEINTQVTPQRFPLLFSGFFSLNCELSLGLISRKSFGQNSSVPIKTWWNFSYL